MTFGVALSAVLTLVVSVVILYLVVIYLSLLTSSGGRTTPHRPGSTGSCGSVHA